MRCPLGVVAEPDQSPPPDTGTDDPEVAAVGDADTAETPAVAAIVTPHEPPAEARGAHVSAAARGASDTAAASASATVVIPTPAEDDRSKERSADMCCDSMATREATRSIARHETKG